MLKKLQTRWFLFWHGSKCLSCGKNGFVHSWSKLSSYEQIRRVLWGRFPTDGRCLLCGTEAKPVLVDMGGYATYPNQEGWLMDWWTIRKSNEADGAAEALRVSESRPAA